MTTGLYQRVIHHHGYLIVFLNVNEGSVNSQKYLSSSLVFVSLLCIFLQETTPHALSLVKKKYISKGRETHPHDCSTSVTKKSSVWFLYFRVHGFQKSEKRELNWSGVVSFFQKCLREDSQFLTLISGMYSHLFILSYFIKEAINKCICWINTRDIHKWKQMNASLH